MSGHSKWSTIKRQKGAKDAKRGAVFTKLGNDITIAAREGGKDPDSNFKLRLAIDRAKGANVPKDNIERAIKRGTGELEGNIIEEITYEGYGPGGIPFLIQALTDNRNRASAAIRHSLTKYGGSLAGPGSVAWMFSSRGVVAVDLESLSDEMELKLIDAGAEDVKHQNGRLVIYTKPDKIKTLKGTLEKNGLNPDYADMEMVAKEEVSADEKAKATLEKIAEELEENEDVKDYFTNVTGL